MSFAVAGRFTDRHLADRHLAYRLFTEIPFADTRFGRQHISPNASLPTGRFADNQFADRTIRRQDNLPNASLPTGRFAECQFADRTFRRQTIRRQTICRQTILLMYGWHIFMFCFIRLFNVRNICSRTTEYGGQP